MSKAAAAETPVGMARGELKQMLRLAHREPVRIAFAQGGDGAAIVVMDRRRQARALEAEIKGGAKNHRFGTASVDPEQPKVVRTPR